MKFLKLSFLTNDNYFVKLEVILSFIYISLLKLINLQKDNAY